MTSASQYNSPYIYKEPPPPIQYPPMFASLNRLSVKHILDSKLLAIAALLFGVGLFVALICVVSPFWFKLVFSSEEGTFGTEAVKRQLSINTGIFFMNEKHFDNLMVLNKKSNQDVVPKLLALAQILEVAGVCLLVACLAGCGILVFRRFAAATANFILAFFSTLSGLCLVLVFVCSLIVSYMSSCDPYDTGSKCVYADNLKWRVIPIYTQIYRVEPLVTPYIKLNWTFYISILAAVITLVGSAFVWLEAIATYRKLCQIRYTQLRTARSPHEGDFDPVDNKKYIYQAPVMAGPMTYGMQPVTYGMQPGTYGMQPGTYGMQPGTYGMQPGMQPVTFQGGHYGQQAYTGPPPTQGHSVGFGDTSFETKKRPSSSSNSPPPRRRSPPPRRSSPSAPPSPGGGGRGRYSPPSRRRSPPPSSRRRSPSPPSRRGGPPSVSGGSTSEGPHMSREIDL